jgi:putative ABC transport system substrate-binding protein
VIIGRRRFTQLFASAVAGWPLAGFAQTASPVIGFLNGASYELSRYLVDAFHQGLHETGYVEGKNVVFDYRSAEGQYDGLPALAADLARKRVTVIVATGTPTGLPAKAATTTIPVVFVTGSDPIEQGLVTNLSRPAGNLTGVTTLAVELGKKRMEMLRAVVPSASYIGALVNQKGPNLDSVLRDMRSAAGSLGVRLHMVYASTVAELESAFADLSQQRVGALVIGTDTFFNSQSAKLGELTRRHALPAVYQYREFTAAGGLMSYAGSIRDAYRLAGVYTGRILKGEKPANLPVQQSVKTELFINLSTAKALGLKVPQSVLVRADEVLE